MRIIREGYVVQLTCERCGAILEVGTSDVYYPEIGGSPYISCPSCGKIIYVTEDNTSLDFMKRVRMMCDD